MKLIITNILILFAVCAFAQGTHTYQSSDMMVHLRGEKKEKHTDFPTTIIVNLDDMTVTISTDVQEIKDMMNNQMTRRIEKKLGEGDEEYSLRLETNTFMHLYLDERKLIMMTRNDVHPMQWGVMFKTVLIVD